MNIAYLILYGYVPYAVMLIFIVGIVYRLVRWLTPKGLTGLYNVNATVNGDDYGKITLEILKRIFLFYTLPDTDNTLFIGSLLFHWGIWIALIGHLGIIIPSKYLESWFGISPSLHLVIALYVGGAAGTIALVGLLILITRRITGRTVTIKLVNEYKVRIPLTMLSFLDDYFAVAILLAIIALGLAQTLGIPPTQHLMYIEQVSNWMWSLITLHPNVSYIVADPLLQVHALLAMIFIAYFPWSKMMHPFSFIYISPTVARPSIKIKVRSVQR